MDRAPTELQLPPAVLDPIRIAIVTETYPPEVNGVAMTMARMVEGMLERRHTIQLIRPRQHAGYRPAAGPAFEEVLTRGVPVPRYDALKLGLRSRES